AGLYEASRDHAPVLAISGDMPRKLQGIDYFQATNANMLFRDVSLYTETIFSPAHAPAVIQQAIAAAYGGRGGDGDAGLESHGFPQSELRCAGPRLRRYRLQGRKPRPFAPSHRRGIQGGRPCHYRLRGSG